MVTLISFGNSEGQRRCDARCYDATGGECDCICAGKNHGAGLQLAEANTREMAETWIDDYCRRENITRADFDAMLGDGVRQGALF
jgi:hypothetical protein